MPIYDLIIIGAGPAGISCACELRALGYEVDIFEAKAQPAGLTVYGVAPYKITNEEVLAVAKDKPDQFRVDTVAGCPARITLLHGPSSDEMGLFIAQQLEVEPKRRLSKAELARKAGVSSLTIDRIERGEQCRLETMRKILFALGYSLEEKDKVFQA